MFNIYLKKFFLSLFSLWPGDNLLLNDEKTKVKIAKFGMSATLKQKLMRTGSKEFKQNTLFFMAPELLTDGTESKESGKEKTGADYFKHKDKFIGRACDVWSVACCLIEMATGEAPWHSEMDKEPNPVLFLFRKVWYRIKTMNS